VDGIIVYNPLPESVENYRLIQQRHVPLLFLNEYLRSMPEVSYVAWNAPVAAAAATGALIEAGRRRIACVGVEYGGALMDGRHRAFRKRLREAGIASRPDWFHWTVREASNLQREARMFDWIASLFKSEESRPDAFFAVHDGVGWMVIESLSALGVKVPEEVAIVSMGNASPPKRPAVWLTTMEEPLEEVGKRGAASMLRLIEQPEARRIRDLVSEVTFVRRDSL
jgi:LacI family transcriptional regulator